MPVNHQQEEWRPLARLRRRVSIGLTCAMLAIYLGFILLVAFGKDLLRRPLVGTAEAPGLSLGIVLGAAVIVSAWVLTGIYAVWANRVLDRRVDEIRRRRRNAP